jgi:hypothetical protein
MDTLLINSSSVLALRSYFDVIYWHIFTVAFILYLGGYMVQIWHHRKEPEAQFTTIASIGLLIILSVSIPIWRPWVTQIFYGPANALSSASATFQVNATSKYFATVLDTSSSISNTATNTGTTTQTTNNNTPKTFGQELKDFVKFKFNIFSLGFNSLLGMVMHIVFFVLDFIASMIFYPFLYLQIATTEILFAFAPIAFALFALPSQRAKATAYFSMLMSVLAWPLGFCLVSAASNLCLIMCRAASYNGNAISTASELVTTGLSATTAIIVASIIFLMGVLLVPPTCLYLFMYGGASFNPISSAGQAVPFVGRLFSFRK